jgi:hypothetical protein
MSVLTRHFLGGAALGGVSGSALSYLASPHKTKKEKQQRIKNTIGGGLLGAYAGGAFGGLHGMNKDPRYYRHSGRYYRRHSAGSGPKPRPDHKPHMHHLDLTGKEATKAEVHKKYKAAAMKHHPDRQGGNAEEMKQVNHAWDNVKGSTWFDKLSFVRGFTSVTRSRPLV